MIRIIIEIDPTAEAAQGRSGEEASFTIAAGGAPYLRAGSVAFTPGEATKTKEVVIKYDIPNSDFEELWINDQYMMIENGGVKVKLPAGTHRMHWRGKGAPNQEYAIEITKPEEAKWKPDPAKRATPQGDVDARHAFTING